ncbi:MAG: SDR family oxidoreductase [Aureliella sp.]
MLAGSTEELYQAVFDTPSPVAFITGSVANRVGRHIAAHFQSAGFRIVVHSHSHPAPQKGATSGGSGRVTASVGGQDVLHLSGGIEDEKQVAAWCDAVLNEHGRCDVLVQSAAIWNPKPLEQTEQADFARSMNVNAIGPALGCKIFGLAMAHQSSGGTIINIGDWAVRRPYRDFAAYMASKGAIKTVTESMAVELALRNPRMRVNCILPGPVMIDERVGAERREQIRQECLLKRQGSADDVAHAALFLATSPFVTGVSLPVDGGRSIYAGPSHDSIAHPEV